MKCLKCGKESKYEFCRECKIIKRKASALLSQNKKKLIRLLKSDWLTTEWFNKFILYTDNIRNYWKLYMEYKAIREHKILKIIIWSINVASLADSDTKLIIYIDN